MKKNPYWSVTVSVDGDDILTIEPNAVCGKGDLSKSDEEAIKTAALHLLAFIGQPVTLNEWESADMTLSK